MTREELDRVYIFSDTHFNNEAVACTRSFRTTFDMNNEIMLHLSQLPDDSIIFFLGDFIDNDLGLDIFSVKRFSQSWAIVGNHDTLMNLHLAGFQKIIESDCLYLNDLDVVLSHAPIRLPDDTSIRNIHGHIHSSPNKYGQAHPEYYYNVSMDVIGYKPKKLTEVLDELHVDYNKKFLQVQTMDNQ